MLSQLKSLSLEADGRYASDAELQFLTDYLASFDLRMQTYLRLQDIEATLVQEAYAKMRSRNPAYFNYGSNDISHKWKQDTIRTLRYTAIAVLTNDSETLRSRFLLWFQTIMRAFNAQESCDATYRVLQELVKHHLTAVQAELVCSVLELNRRYLGLSV
jgi:hypothetical protein